MSDTCSVCGDVAIVTMVSTMATVVDPWDYGACPPHVDTVIARMQDTLHETALQRQGALEDWWADQHPHVEPQVEEPPSRELEEPVRIEPIDEGAEDVS